VRLRIGLILLLTAAVAGCGGGTKNVAKSARPCLEKLGEYLHHVPRTTRTQTVALLPVLDPTFRPSATQLTRPLAWPDDLQEYGEVLFDPKQPGANALQVLIFADDDLPQKIVAQARRPPCQGCVTTQFPGRRTVRIGQTVLLWSSAPTPKQRRSVGACFD
jgi:hypothetical protein